MWTVLWKHRMMKLDTRHSYVLNEDLELQSVEDDNVDQRMVNDDHVDAKYVDEECVDSNALQEVVKSKRELSDDD